MLSVLPQSAYELRQIAFSLRIASGGTDNGAAAARLYYDPRYYVLDPDALQRRIRLQVLAVLKKRTGQPDHVGFSERVVGQPKLGKIPLRKPRPV